MEWSKDVKQSVWTEITAEKITKQAELLEKLGKTEAEMLRGYVYEMEFADATNREGHAAKVYFNALFGKDFTRTEECPLNAALNYGYSIILSSFNREIVANGYVTQIGVFHDNMFNQFNLGSDFMEPFRPVVDELVYHMRPEIFEAEEKHQLLKMLDKELYIDGKKEYLSNVIKIYTRSLFESLNDRDVSLIKFYSL